MTDVLVIGAGSAGVVAAALRAGHLGLTIVWQAQQAD
jgi:pyruvate/2-oxoglutarate dehydrogenase complex dihydrolipoamide dehydrogenase (E3) component